nr:pentatricopeptide repeat-containing protein, chloroplastic [Quercus suber]
MDRGNCIAEEKNWHEPPVAVAKAVCGSGTETQTVFLVAKLFLFIYTTAFDVLGKVNRPVEALNSSHSMQQQVSTYPDLVAYQCIAVTLGKAGYLKELFDVIDSMRSPPKKKFKTEVIGKWDPELEPDIMVYAVLNACVQQKKWEGAFWVLQ